MKQTVAVTAVSLVRIPQGQPTPPAFTGITTPIQVTVGNDMLQFSFIVDGLQANPRCGDKYEVDIRKIPELGDAVDL